jgi:hypothetical protein
VIGSRRRAYGADGPRSALRSTEVVRGRRRHPSYSPKVRIMETTQQLFQTSSDAADDLGITVEPLGYVIVVRDFGSSQAGMARKRFATIRHPERMPCLASPIARSPTTRSSVAAV